MDKYLRYSGEFLSRAGVVWRVEIWQDSDKPFAIVGDLDFEADEPLMIEWSDTDKEDVICGSVATLRLNSPGDRTYEDMYTVEPGSIRMDVYRDGGLYWSGALDPEFYEEPYERAANYPVSLTFSDFGILKRRNFSLSGTVTLRKIAAEAVFQMGISTQGIDEHISSSLDEGLVLKLEDLSVRSANFFDEDGEASSLYEAIEGILQPLGLRIVQRHGRIHIYDLNALCSMEPERLEWSGSSSTMSTDKVANSVRVTFSPYAEATLISGKLEHSEVLKNANPEDGDKFLTGHRDGYPLGFTIWHGEQEGLPLTLSNNAQYYRIDSHFSGSDEAGVVWNYLKPGVDRDDSEGYKDLALGEKNDFNPCLKKVGDLVGGNVEWRDPVPPVPIITTRQGEIFNPAGLEKSYKLRVSLQTLFDVRYNPFESAERSNEEGNYDRMMNWCNFGYIPAMLYLKDVDGNVLYHYENKAVMESNSFTASEYGDDSGEWKPGAGTWGDMYLAYYDVTNRKSATGFGGWQTNRQIIGYDRDKLPKAWTVRNPGEYIVLPPEGGYLELQIGSGLHQFDYERQVKNIYRRARWLLYKEPEIEVVHFDGRDIEGEDVEYSGWLNRAAKDDISIDTICGTGRNLPPTARGMLLVSATSEPLTMLSRGGVTDHPEKLLIGTLYSQYATRHTALSGEAEICRSGLAPLSEANQPGKIFMIKGETQNVIADTTEIAIVELSPDEYEPIEEII